MIQAKGNRHGNDSGMDPVCRAAVRAVADFYAAAFGATELATHDVAAQLAAVEMCLGGAALTVAGANPKRQAEPNRDGPLHPPAAGTVSAIARLTVIDIDATLRGAIDAGATVRVPAQIDAAGRRVAALFDPAGHIWTLTGGDPALRANVAEEPVPPNVIATHPMGYRIRYARVGARGFSATR